MTDISSTTTPIDTTNKSWESTYGGSETALASPAEPKVEPMKETVETAGPSKAPRTAKPKPAKKPVAKKSKLPPTPKPQRHRNPPLPKEQSKKRGPRGFVSDYRGELVCKFSDFTATARLNSNGLLVLRGSQASLTVNKVAFKKTPGRFKERQGLIDAKTLIKDGKCLVFAKDQQFKSLSAAAICIVGLPVNGLMYFKTREGKRLNELK